MRILLIKLRHIGDALIMTPAAVAIRNQYPDVHIAAVVRKGCEGILAGCPEIDEIHTTAAGREGSFGRRPSTHPHLATAAVRLCL